VAAHHLRDAGIPRCSDAPIRDPRRTLARPIESGAAAESLQEDG
jgi:hypothetical protein